MVKRGRLVTAIATIRWSHQFVLAAQCIAEAALFWLGASALFVVPTGAEAIPPWLIFALVWGSAQVPRALDALDVWEPWHQVAMSAAILVSLGMAIHAIGFPDAPWWDGAWMHAAVDGAILRSTSANVPIWGVVGVVAVVWWRTYFRGEPTRDAAFRLLRAGSIGIVAGACLLAIVERGEHEVDSAGAVLTFFVAALAAIGLSRFTSGDQAGQADPSLRAVLTGLLPAAAVLTLGVLVTGILRRDVVDTVAWSLGPVIWAISVVVRVIVLAVALVAVVLMTPFFLLLEGRSFRFGSFRFDGSNLQPSGIVDRATESARALPDPIRYLIALAVLFLVFAGVTRFVLRRRKRRFNAPSDEERSRIRPLLDLPALLADLLRRLGLGGAEALDDPLDRLRNDNRWAATVLIRERYRALLIWSADRNQPRQLGQTPVEHAARLARVLRGEDARQDVATISRLYGRARYSSEPASTADADAVQAAWRRLERAGRTER